MQLTVSQHLSWDLRVRFLSRRILRTLAVAIMPLMALTLFLICSALAQVEVTVPGQGRVGTVVKVENGVLGVTNTFVRQRAFAKECVGACFYANATKTKTWVCRNSDCNLDCSGREPVGGC